jgi:putative oxidoreductase
MKRSYGLSDWLALLARIALSLTFLVSGIHHLGHWEATITEMQRAGLPTSDFLLAGSVALRLVGGMLVLTGWFPRVGAILLAAFLLPTTFLLHAWWRAPADRGLHESIEFLNSLAMLAGMLMVLAFGAGQISIESAFPRMKDRRDGTTPVSR